MGQEFWGPPHPLFLWSPHLPKIILDTALICRQLPVLVACLCHMHREQGFISPLNFYSGWFFFLGGGKGTTPPLHTHQVCIITSLPFIFIFHHSLVPYREKHSLVPDSAPPKAAGTLNNAAEFAIARVDDLINWGRRVCAMFKFPILYLIKIEIMGKSTHRF